MDHEKPGNKKKKTVSNISFQTETLNVIEPSRTELTPTKPNSFKYQREVPRKPTRESLTRLKTEYNKKIPARKLLGKTFIADIPEYVSLWPRSEVVACYFQFVALLTSVLAIEYTQFNLQFNLSKGSNTISLAGDKLTRVMLIIQAVVLGIGVFIRVTWSSKREEMTAAAMGLIMAVIVLAVNGLNDKPSDNFLIANVVVSLVSCVLSISLYPPVQPYDEEKTAAQEIESEINPARKLSKVMNVGTFLTGSMAATRYRSVLM